MTEKEIHSMLKYFLILVTEKLVSLMRTLMHKSYVLWIKKKKNKHFQELEL